MLNDKIIRHVLDILIEEHGPSPGGRDRPALEELIRKRAAQINTLVAQMQDWVHTDDVEFILDPVTLRRGRATVTRAQGSPQAEQALITF